MHYKTGSYKNLHIVAAFSTSDRSQWKPGDLLFPPGGGHVTIYAGGNQVVHAPKQGDVVKYADIWFEPMQVRRYI